VSRILIVEDHQKLQESLRRGLEILGHEVLTAETGEQGYNLALCHAVDIVVLDLMLPGRNGFEILVDLRKADFRQPILILTAKDSPEDRRRGRACGADGFLIKPFAFADLVARLNELLKGGASGPPSAENPPCAS
jgi:two-component system, OmpR family, copper resistance phosphate regulon response regulator CusR